MQFSFTEGQQLIRDTARGFLDERATSDRIRAAWALEVGFDAAMWHELAADLGWAGIAIPERYGGMGLGWVELALLQQELGRRIVPSPFFSTVCLAAPLILECGSEAQKSCWLPRIATGAARIAVGLSDCRGVAGPAGVSVELRRSGNALRLSGEVDFVIHGDSCETLLIAARKPGTTREEGLALALIEPERAGVTIEKHVMLDLTRPMARIRLENVAVEDEAVLGSDSLAEGAFERALDLARIALAAEAVGGAEWTLEMTTGYVKERRQFDRPIGSFQAVKHRLADMMVLVEAAKSAAWYAACVADERPEELAEAAAIAKAACCDAFCNCAANAIQLHGGIGFTWEHDAHLYFKRARAASTLLGTPAWHRERLARLVGLGETLLEPAH